jgi:hypothetical protein
VSGCGSCKSGLSCTVNEMTRRSPALFEKIGLVFSFFFLKVQD